MKKTMIEPGLLPIFRLFTGIQLGGLLVFSIGSFVLPAEPLEGKIAVLSGVGVTVLLLGYLSWPALERRLGSLYLPLALLVSSLITLAVQSMGMQHDFTDYISTAREMSLLLVFPLLVTSWQYRMRAVLLFCLATGLLDMLFAIKSAPHADLIASHYLRTVFARSLVFMVIGYIVSHLMREQRAQRKALQQANAELVHYAATLEQLTVSRERNRVARELHDTVAHTLSGMAVQLEAVRSLWEVDNSQARTLLERALASTRHGLTETRRALQALRASPLEDLGLVLALRNLVEGSAARAGLVVDMQLPEDKLELPPDLEQGVYRVAQEALENIVKHAEAHRVSLQLFKVNNVLTLKVGDDGCGFDPGRVDGDQHFGLKGMYERARLMGGRLEVVSQPGQGTTVTLKVEVEYAANFIVR
jgi:signal transduction histidine kinase